MLADEWLFWRIVNAGLATIAEADALALADLVRANVMLRCARRSRANAEEVVSNGSAI